jgi:leucyl aminopeptidase
MFIDHGLLVDMGFMIWYAMQKKSRANPSLIEITSKEHESKQAHVQLVGTCTTF